MSDWPLLNTASGATWVSLHHGGDVGMGFSQHAGMVIVADGTPEAAKRLERAVERPGDRRHAPRSIDTGVHGFERIDASGSGFSGVRWQRPCGRAWASVGNATR